MQAEQSIIEAHHDSPVQTIVVESGSSDLLRIALKTFDGDYAEYPVFIDAFKALVDENRSRGMSDIKRFGILLKYLGPNVMKAMQHFRVTAENYKPFLEALDRRYGKKHLIFDKLIGDLFKIKPAHDVSSLRQVADASHGLIKSLHQMANNDEIKDGILIFLLREKCDTAAIGKWEEKIAAATKLTTWEEFNTFLEGRCTVLECTHYTTSFVHGVQSNGM